MHYEKFADDSVKCIEDEIPFELPDGWAWLRLQSFIDFIGGSQPPKSTFEYSPSDDNIRLIQIRDYKTDKFMTFIPRDKARRFCSKNDVMIGRYGPPIFQILRGLEGSYNVALMKAVADPQIVLNDYLFYLLQDGELLRMLESLSDRTCGQDGINMYELNRYIVGIPPLNEQRRIIDFIEKAVPLVESVTKLKEEMSALIFQAKSKILDMAIRGRLVPQDPADEPASLLLERIRAEKEELIKQGKIKRDKKESFIFRGDDNSYYRRSPDGLEDITDDLPYDIPDSWEWTSISELFSINPRNKIAEDMVVSFIPMPLIDDGYSGCHRSETKEWKSIKTGFSHFQNGDIGIAKITPCFENRKSVIFRDLCNGYGAGTTELHILRPQYRDCVLPEYALALLKSERFIQSGMQAFTGAVGQQRIGKDYVMNTYFPLPPYAEQRRIIDRINKLFTLIATIESAL